MDKPTLKQLWDFCVPYIAPFLGMFIGLARFWKNHTKEIDEKFETIKIDVAVLKKDTFYQSEKIDKIDKEQGDLADTIKQIAHDVSTIKGQKEGVSLAVLEQIEHLERLIGTKFSQYERSLKDHDRRIVIISKRQEKQRIKA